MYANCPNIIVVTMGAYHGQTIETLTESLHR